jgi:hypothetical protein
MHCKLANATAFASLRTFKTYLSRSVWRNSVRASTFAAKPVRYSTRTPSESDQEKFGWLPASARCAALVMSFRKQVFWFAFTEPVAFWSLIMGSSCANLPDACIVYCGIDSLILEILACSLIECCLSEDAKCSPYVGPPCWSCWWEFWRFHMHQHNKFAVVFPGLFRSVGSLRAINCDVAPARVMLDHHEFTVADLSHMCSIYVLRCPVYRQAQAISIRYCICVQVSFYR